MATDTDTTFALLAAFNTARDDYADLVETDVRFGNWSDPVSGRAYAAAIRQASAWAVSDRRIAANAPRTGLAASLLDRAAARVSDTDTSAAEIIGDWDAQYTAIFVW